MKTQKTAKRRGAEPKVEPGSPKALALAKLESSGLTAEDAERLGAKELGRTEMHDLLKKTGGPRQFGWAAGLHLPYFDEDGKKMTRPNEGGEQVGFYRVRGLGAGAYGEVPSIRYAQPKVVGTPVYLPQLLDWRELLSDPKRQIVITEGELKAASACAHGIPCVALGGVYNFKSKKAGIQLDPLLAKLAAGGREIVIAFDADALPKPGVEAAQSELALRLLDAGAVVKIARLPQLEHGTKTGLDDLIVGRGPEAAAAAIAGAEEFEGQRALHELNKRYVLVRRPVCIFEHGSGAIYTEASFRLLERNRAVPGLDRWGKPTAKEAGVAWLEWPKRSEARAMVYAPGKATFTEDGAVNVWPGWGCDSVEGDVSLWHALLDHVFLGADPSIRRWFEQWCAYPVQHPGAKLYTATVLVSTEKGVGKSLVAELLGEVYGVKAAGRTGTCSVITPKELGSAFSEWLLGTSLVVCEEMTGEDYRTRKALMDELKHLVTGATVQINDKGVPRFPMENRANLMFLTNHPDALRVEDNDRRFMVHRVTAPRMPVELGKRIADWGRRTKHGPAALRHYLENVDLAGFIPEAEAPFTEAKGQMIDAHKSELDTFVSDLVTSPGELLASHFHGAAGDIAEGCDLLSIRQIVEMYERTRSEHSTPANDSVMAKALLATGRACRYPNAGLVRVPGRKSRRLWAIRNANEWARCQSKDWGQHYARFFPSDASVDGCAPKYSGAKP